MDTPDNGRDDGGRFAAGNRRGKGRPKGLGYEPQRAEWRWKMAGPAVARSWRQPLGQREFGSQRRVRAAGYDTPEKLKTNGSKVWQEAKNVTPASDDSTPPGRDQTCEPLAPRPITNGAPPPQMPRISCNNA